MKKQLIKTNKEIVSYDFLGGDGKLPNMTESSLQDIEEWIDNHLPDENFDKEDLMERVREIRKQAGIIDP